MARPVKCRRVCHFPETREFTPNNCYGESHIVLALDEYETVRLIDKEGLSQEECGEQLGVGRTTAQKIYDTARKKIADALVQGMPLKIEGGEYKICNGNVEFCYKKDCYKKQVIKNFYTEKGENTMRIAVTYDNGNVFQHFGHTEQFKVFDVEDGKIVDSKVVDTNGFGHGALAGLLSAIKADVLICGGIGGGAQRALTEAGIKLYGGVTGNADEVVNVFLSGKLDYNPDVHCDHHNHEHGEGTHTCGEHGCGKGSCGETASFN